VLANRICGVVSLVALRGKWRGFGPVRKARVFATLFFFVVFFFFLSRGVPKSLWGVGMAWGVRDAARGLLKKHGGKRFEGLRGR